MICQETVGDCSSPDSSQEPWTPRFCLPVKQELKDEIFYRRESRWGTSILVLYASNYSSQIDEPLSSPLSLPSSLLHVYFSSPLCGCVVICNILWILKILSKRKFLLANLHRCPSSLKFIFSPLLLTNLVYIPVVMDTMITFFPLNSFEDNNTISIVYTDGCCTNYTRSGSGRP